ncbi:hypothetical protein [Aeromonas caviae]|uniref:hypothetical protein n=1 Tax=Aeromonas caviae TaxID=648 RepID=UPI00191E9DFB|nr:hypothetical protein [Aeromonas caviae]MBL0541719.1 hypothetical protein [Aeromonas caviae]
MPTINTSRLPAPKSWDEFEDICKSACSLRWANPNLSKHGRQGQQQNGVDIYGKDSLDKLVGVQCKNTTSSISQKLIESECTKAESFIPKLETLYIATTAERDVKIQKFARILSESRKSQGKFPIEVLFWEDIVSDLSRDEKTVRLHFPQYFSTSSKTYQALAQEKDLSHLTALLNVIDLTSTHEHLKWGAKYIHCSLVEQLHNINTVIKSPVFILSDNILSENIDSLISEWTKLITLVRKAPYNLVPHMNTLSFHMPGDFCQTKEDDILYNEIDIETTILSEKITSFCNFINKTYPSINIMDTSNKARSLY